MEILIKRDTWEWFVYRFPNWCKTYQSRRYIQRKIGLIPVRVIGLKPHIERIFKDMYKNASLYANQYADKNAGRMSACDLVMATIYREAYCDALSRVYERLSNDREV